MLKLQLHLKVKTFFLNNNMGIRFSRCFGLDSYVRVLEPNREISEDFFGHGAFEDIDLDENTIEYRNPKGKK